MGSYHGCNFGVRLEAPLVARYCVESEIPPARLELMSGVSIFGVVAGVLPAAPPIGCISSSLNRLKSAMDMRLRCGDSAEALVGKHAASCCKSPLIA